MKTKLFLLVITSLAISYSSLAMSIRPCSDEQKNAYSTVGNTPQIMASFHVITNLASYALAIQSLSKDKTSSDSQNTPIWVPVLLGPMLVSAFSFPRCSSMIIENNEIQHDKTEQQIRHHVRAVWGISLVGQGMVLANTIDSENRKSIVTLMGASAIAQGLFELTWSFNKPSAPTVIIPWQQNDSRGFAVHFQF